MLRWRRVVPIWMLFWPYGRISWASHLLQHARILGASSLMSRHEYSFRASGTSVEATDWSLIRSDLTVRLPFVLSMFVHFGNESSATEAIGQGGSPPDSRTELFF